MEHSNNVLTPEERGLIAAEVVESLKAQTTFCTTCKMDTAQHRAEHEAIREMIPVIRDLRDFIDRLKNMKWAIAKYFIIFFILVVLSLAGIKIGGIK